MPALLHTSKESRVYLLGHYRLSFAGGSLLSSGVPRTHFNFNIDVCFLPLIGYFDYTDSHVFINTLNTFEQTNLRYLAIDRAVLRILAASTPVSWRLRQVRRAVEALPALDTLSEVDNIDDYLNRSRLVKSASLPADPARGNQYFFRTLASEKLAQALEVKEQRVKSAAGGMWLRIQPWTVRNKMRLVSWSVDTPVVIARVGRIWTNIKDEESGKLVHRVEEHIVKRVALVDFLLDDCSHF